MSPIIKLCCVQIVSLYWMLLLLLTHFLHEFAKMYLCMDIWRLDGSGEALSRPKLIHVLRMHTLLHWSCMRVCKCMVYMAMLGLHLATPSSSTSHSLNLSCFSQHKNTHAPTLAKEEEGFANTHFLGDTTIATFSLLISFLNTQYSYVDLNIGRVWMHNAH
jgi:hypothetical protein